MNKLIIFIKEYKWIISGIVLGAGLISFGLVSSLVADSKKDAIIINTSHIKDKEKEVTFETIVVDVEGAVTRPGVVRLAVNSRVGEAIGQAGGFTQRADKLWIMKHINLAAKITDGSKIYVPFAGEVVAYDVVPVDSGNSPSAATNMSNVVNINSASSEQLDTLSGIGPVTAQKIIDNRPYQSIEDLLNKKILGRKVFDNIKDKISIN